MSDATHELRPAKARWTHIALRVKDIDATIEWYIDFTPMELLDRRSDDAGHGAWLGMADNTEDPFILVVAQFFTDTDPFSFAPIAVLAPFAHLGIEMPTKDEVDSIAERGEQAGCLAMPPTTMPPPIGYICMLNDPDGNTIEFSWDQGVYAKVRERWGNGNRPGN